MDLVIIVDETVSWENELFVINPQRLLYCFKYLVEAVFIPLNNDDKNKFKINIDFDFDKLKTWNIDPTLGDQYPNLESFTT